ncbi:hypothetical protein HDU76_006420, partial [Blyttiomyces sp. JEL0837]
LRNEVKSPIDDSHPTSIDIASGASSVSLLGSIILLSIHLRRGCKIGVSSAGLSRSAMSTKARLLFGSSSSCSTCVVVNAKIDVDSISVRDGIGRGEAGKRPHEVIKSFQMLGVNPNSEINAIRYPSASFGQFKVDARFITLLLKFAYFGGIDVKTNTFSKTQKVSEIVVGEAV